MGDGSVQMDNVSGRVMEPRYMFFYSMKEFLLALIQWNQTQAGGVCMIVCVCMWVGGVSPMPWELAAAQSVRANFVVVLAVSY